MKNLKIIAIFCALLIIFISQTVSAYSEFSWSGFLSGKSSEKQEKELVENYSKSGSAEFSIDPIYLKGRYIPINKEGVERYIDYKRKRSNGEYKSYGPPTLRGMGYKEYLANKRGVQSNQYSYQTDGQYSSQVYQFDDETDSQDEDDEKYDWNTQVDEGVQDEDETGGQNDDEVGDTESTQTPDTSSTQDDQDTQVVDTNYNYTQTTTGDRTPSPLTVKQIHSGHSLTDSAVYQVWPGHYSRMIDYLAGGNGNVGISTIPGSPMSWRWDHSSGDPDAKNDIADWELLVITEGVPMGGSGSQAMFRQWVEHAWNNGNNGNGAPTLLYATWTGLEQGETAWRAELDDYVSRWEAMADYGSQTVPAEARVYIVPGNYLMMRLYDDIQAGLVPGVTSIRDFFRDDIHTSHLGSYALALMHIAVIHHVDPHNVPGTGWGLSPEPSAALTTYLQDIVWEIVQEYPYAGV